ncbi:MAG: hypothetical protein WCW31_05540 [Patescibacteria group bacterium]
MQLFNRRVSAVLLIVLGLALLGFGIWIIASMFFSKAPVQQPANQTNVYQKPAPKIYAAPVTLTGTSTSPSNAKSSDAQEAVNKASTVVSRFGSGTSADGFLGYSDVMIDGTDNFKTQMLAEQKSMQQAHPVTGPLYGITTRIVSSDVVQGKNGEDKFVVKVSAQKAVDSGDRSKPTLVSYMQYMVMLAKQNGTLLVDSISEQVINQ